MTLLKYIFLLLFSAIHPTCWWDQVTSYEHCMSSCLNATYVYVHVILILPLGFVPGTDSFSTMLLTQINYKKK